MIAKQENNAQAVTVRRKGKAGPAAMPVQVKGDAWKGGELGECRNNLILTRKQRAVLEVIMDPSMANATVEERIKRAGVSLQTYYNVLQMPHVEAERQRLVKQLVTQAVAPAIAACAATAMTQGRDGFQDRRLLLSMSGDYVERKQQDVNVSGSIVGVVGVALADL
jgi:predicted DNA-binding protein YlxM (UPF0122 family)